MDINKEELVELLESTEGIVVVDFWAAWCGPCRMLARYYKGFAEDNPGVEIKKVEVDQNEGVSKDYGVRTLPTIIFFKDGVEVDRMTGLQTTVKLQEKLNELTEE
jgi:thioredoxin 1